METNQMNSELVSIRHSHRSRFPHFKDHRPQRNEGKGVMNILLLCDVIQASVGHG